MDEIVKKVAADAGISEEQARKAVNCVAGYLKERLPGMLQSQIDPILNGKSWDDSIRDQATALGEEVRNRADGLVVELKEAFDKAFKKKS